MYAEWYKQRLRTRSIDLIAAAKLRFGSNMSERSANSDGMDLIAAEKKTVNILIKRSRILFEVVIPSISVTGLLAVTIYVSLDAVRLTYIRTYLTGFIQSLKNLIFIGSTVEASAG